MARSQRENLPQETTYEEARKIVVQKFIDNPNLRSAEIIIDKETHNLGIITTEYAEGFLERLNIPLTN